MFEKFMPDIYQKSIYYINYDKLKKKGVSCLLFDMDNTITPTNVNKPTVRLKKLFDDLKSKGFRVIIISNAPKYRIKKFKNDLEVDCAAFSLKPSKDKYLEIMEKFKLKHTEIACIGDQLITDIWGANRHDFVSILVNPLTTKDHTITFMNRLLEKNIYNKLAKMDLLKIGRYYE